MPIDADDPVVVTNQQPAMTVVTSTVDGKRVVANLSPQVVVTQYEPVPSFPMMVGSPGPQGPPGVAGGGGPALYIQNSAPVNPSLPYMWVQADFPSAGNQTVWVAY